MSSHFDFLKAEWPAVHEAAARAEVAALSDARTSCFYSRRALELAVAWLYRHESSLRLPYQENLSALIHEPTFKKVAGDAVFAKTRVIQRLGNDAVHSPKPIHQFDAVTALRELFHVCFWLARTYAAGAKPADNWNFDQARLPATSNASTQNFAQLQNLAKQLAEKDEKLSEEISGKEALNEELKRLREEIAAIKKKNTATPDAHDYSEAVTREVWIDALLKEAGWTFAQPGHDTEFPVTGMPNESGEGFVDYVLWGDNGLPLAIVEAKRTRKSAPVGQQQAKLYADCLEKQFGGRPVIFYSNGYEHWLWDDTNQPPREVQGFYKKNELELLIQRRTTRQKLAEASLNESIVGRYYQVRAIRRIGEAFERDHERRALLVMATGSGKTRTVIALCDLLIRCNWVKRVLFLADRVSLVNQAVGEFKKFLPDSSPVNLVTEKGTQGRVYVSTYPTMMGLIDETKDGLRPFGVGHFDLIVVDEAHRSVYQKYRAIFEYFDSLLVGLTATPRDEIDRDTYGLFGLEKGVPTDAYDLETACQEGYLVRPNAVSVPLRFQREGIKYDDLTDEEKAEWDEAEWDEDGNVPDRVSADAVNKWLFNKDTVDKVLEHLMQRGLKVAGGDRLGKTIIFAKNQPHAEYIAERFDANYPHLKGAFARVVHCKLPYAQSIIDDFSQKDKNPHIAISVDMLDTGIDVPEVLNLVFFKLVRSKTKFWQMLGRGTRLCPDLFGPGMHKEFFQIFDYCQNLEYFSQEPASTEGAVSASLAHRLFSTRVELVASLDKAINEDYCAPSEYISPLAPLRKDITDLLREEVTAMKPHNFIVRPKRRFVEKFSAKEAWTNLSDEDRAELVQQLAGLPSEIPAEDEEAKRFDLIMLRLQLAHLEKEPGFKSLKERVQAIAGLLEEIKVPTVQAHIVLIQEIMNEEWWEGVTVSMMETARKHLRSLIKLIEKKARKIVYTNFEDQMGNEATIELPGFSSGDAFARFRAKARQFLKDRENHISIHKLRHNEPLTTSDLAELEKMLLENGVGSSDDVAKAKKENQGLGIFVRSLIGMDRNAAKESLAGFINKGKLNSNQIQFLDEMVNHLTEQGIMDPARLYESPFTSFNDRGVEGLFSSPQVDELITILDEVRSRAVT